MHFKLYKYAFSSTEATRWKKQAVFEKI